uniref:Interleukin 2 receptor, beta n=1 Tax=Neogobius melanostomus TaxID=47308 RepID=A0A8C6WF89_9GOBI
NVTCTWRHAAFSPSSDCRLSGVQVAYAIENSRRPFNIYETLPNISVRCNNTLVETILNYSPLNHIKMQPPGTPNVSSSANVTRISWSPGSPRSKYIKSFHFQVQIKHAHQSWNVSAFNFSSEPTQVPEMAIWRKLTGHLQVQVRVKPDRRDGSHWSHWSPITSWVAHDEEAPSEKEEGGRYICVVLCILLAILNSTVTFYFNGINPVPNPSKYFRSLHSVNGGNLKKWLNPVSVSDSFFVSRPCEEISAVEVCEAWDVVPASSPCSTSALLHSSSGDNPHSSGSSSCFSNMGYFMSSDNSSSSRTRTSPYFSYPDNARVRTGNFSSLCSLQREPQSPDSGFGIGRLEDQDMECLDDNQNSPLLLRLPLSVSSFSPAPPSFPSDANLVFDNQGLEEDAPTVASPALSGNLSAWPVAEPMCRASSLPVDTSKSGYLTLKELQTTFSNKSI